ncbi:arginase family protein [Nonomuraea mesophila]|uniref:arginase family protein n=1 Tax=Nonomuraea mesophila TaxID=2530382 RepID=UPI001C70984B|nr:arginase family protein [Nonomuraea mesophila]
MLADMVNADHQVPVDADDDLIETAARVREAVQRVRGGLMVTAGGDCGVELEPVAAARKRFGDRLVVVWFDAHGDVSFSALKGPSLQLLAVDGFDGSGRVRQRDSLPSPPHRVRRCCGPR